jgi:hypothetical protein
MDTLWGQAKDASSADKHYASIDKSVDRFLRSLQSLSVWDAWHTAGVTPRTSG